MLIKNISILSNYNDLKWYIINFIHLSYRIGVLMFLSKAERCSTSFRMWALKWSAKDIRVTYIYTVRLPLQPTLRLHIQSTHCYFLGNVGRVSKARFSKENQMPRCSRYISGHFLIQIQCKKQNKTKRGMKWIPLLLELCKFYHGRDLVLHLAVTSVLRTVPHKIATQWTLVDQRTPVATHKPKWQRRSLVSGKCPL